MSTVPGDIPSRLIKEFALELSYPLCDIIVTCIRKGQWPVLWKRELVTPIAKVYPPTDRSLLRKISGLLQFDKVAEKIIAEWIISDLKTTRDKSQYGNEKGLSVNHYLINLIHEIVTNLDKQSRGETFAAIATQHIAANYQLT